MLRIAKTLLLTYYAYMLEYRAELFLWVISSSLPFILMGIWIKAAQTQDFALNSVQFAQYFFAVFLARQSNAVWVIWDFERDVVQGKLSPRLLQPLDPVFHYFFSHISERFARLPFVLAVAIFFFVLYPQSFWLPKLTTILTFLFILLISFILRFLIQYTLALFAFWTERASALEQLWSLPYIFLSGIVAPLDVFPSGVREVVLWTPFPYLVHFPAAFLVGLPVDFKQGLLVILSWGIVFFVINRWLWRRGLRQYSGMGA